MTTTATRRATRLIWATFVIAGCFAVAAFQATYTAWAVSLSQTAPEMLVLPAFVAVAAIGGVASFVASEVKFRRALRRIETGAAVQ
jgi:hypothetical protein